VLDRALGAASPPVRNAETPAEKRADTADEEVAGFSAGATAETAGGSAGSAGSAGSVGSAGSTAGVAGADEGLPGSTGSAGSAGSVAGVAGVAGAAGAAGVAERSAGVTPRRAVPGGAELVHLRLDAHTASIGPRLPGEAPHRPAVQRQEALPADGPTWMDDLLHRAVDRIAAENFPPTPGPACAVCRFARSCPARPEGDQVIT
jgi:hypothetical protein